MKLADAISKLRMGGNVEDARPTARLRLHPRDLAAVLRQLADVVEAGEGKGGRYLVEGEWEFISLGLSERDVIGVHYMRQGSFDVDFSTLGLEP